VAEAVASLLSRPRPSQTINLPGPSTLTYEYLLDLVSSVTLQPPSRAPVLPRAIATILAKVGQNIWWPTLSPDEVIRRYIDDVDVSGDWEAVGVQPTEIEDTAIAYLRRYRSAYVHIPFAFWLIDKHCCIVRTTFDRSCSHLVLL
jgi:NADH dehydrogenase (ubiquinone) 1 alpha subcomplex subunit 9